MEQILDKLEKFRLENKLTKQQLAKKLGLRSSVSMFYWEKRGAVPYPRTLRKIYRLLGTKMSLKETKKVMEDLCQKK